MSSKELLTIPGIIALLGIFAVGALSIATIKVMIGSVIPK